MNKNFNGVSRCKTPRLHQPKPYDQVHLSHTPWHDPGRQQGSQDKIASLLLRLQDTYARRQRSQFSDPISSTCHKAAGLADGL